MQTFGASRSGSAFIYVVLLVLIATSSSIFNPVMSYFLSTELSFNSLKIALFFMLLPLGTIGIVQTVGFFSDHGLQRPAIICIASLFGIASAILLYSRPSFLVLCTLGLLLLGTYPVSFPQIFASAREYALIHLKSSVMFTTFLRALGSLSWVIGAPLSFTIALNWGFNYLFIVAIILFIASALTSFFFLPHIQANEHQEKAAANSAADTAADASTAATAPTTSAPADATVVDVAPAAVAPAKGAATATGSATVVDAATAATVAPRQPDGTIKWWQNRSILILCLSFTLSCTAANSYGTTMPLYLTKELGWSATYPGQLMAVAAFLEIPLMFLGARIANVFGLKNLVLVGTAAILIFLLIFPLTTTMGQMFWLQIFPALFIGTVGSLGMVLFQDLLPEIPGQATSLYINTTTAGQIAGGALIALATSGTYTIVFQVGAGLALIALVLLFFVEKPPRAN